SRKMIIISQIDQSQILEKTQMVLAINLHSRKNSSTEYLSTNRSVLYCSVSTSSDEGSTRVFCSLHNPSQIKKTEHLIPSIG
ncbi:MAG: hypothetical protein OXC03_10515, partial [Flavobacteriaceae bacterium]|nr:hypothetical protein [Flavobacteriaceae bacterium]